MSRKRIIALLWLLAFVAVAGLGAWFASTRIESPADAAARTAPPAPSPILVPVEERVLSSSIVTRGTARFGLPQPISIAPSVLKPSPGLITTLPLRNAQLGEGSVLLTASGRPTFLLQGATPAYRDLVPGIRGEDVRQLERGLVRLGFDPGPVDGTYDGRTSAGVARWYSSGGWEPFGPTLEQQTLLRTMERDLADANKLKLATADAATAAVRAVEAARAAADHRNRVAAAERATAVSERALIVLDPRQTKAARDAAERRLETAEAGVRSAQLQGEAEIQAARDAQKVAQLDAQLAAERADRLAQDVALTRKKLGVGIPVDEVVFVPTLPVRVHEVTALVGDVARGPVLSVTDNQLMVDSSLPLDAAPLVKSGMQVTIDEQALGIKAKGLVERVAETPGTRGVDGYHFYFEVRVTETPGPLEGVSLRLTIPIESTKGAVVAVPISALSLAADGTSRVQVQNSHGLQYVVVEPGLSADGYVEVSAVEGEIAPGQLVVVGYGDPENPE